MRRLIILFVAFMIIVGCEDHITVTDSLPPPHYLDNWVGEYSGERITTSWSINGPSTSTTTLDTVLVIMADDSSVFVDQTYVPLDTNGYFFIHQGGSNYYSIEFTDSDSLHQSTGSGGLGGGVNSVFRGRKK